MRNVLCANESINFKNTNFKIAGRTQRWIVECLATVRFTKSHIFVHPYGLPIAVLLCEKKEKMKY